MDVKEDHIPQLTSTHGFFAFVNLCLFAELIVPTYQPSYDRSLTTSEVSKFITARRYARELLEWIPKVFNLTANTTEINFKDSCWQLLALQSFEIYALFR